MPLRYCTQTQLGYGALSSHLDLTLNYFQKFSVRMSAHPQESTAGDCQPHCFFPLYFLLTGLTQVWGDSCGFNE